MIKMSSAVITLLMAVLALTNAACAFQFSMAELDIAKTISSQIPGKHSPAEILDLTFNLIDTDTLEATKHKILSTFEKTHKRSPCHYVATTALTRECALLETGPNFNQENTEPSVDEILAEAIRAYAARAAVCELQEADSKIPKACHAFQQSEIAKKIERPQDQLTFCTIALGSEPQSWTSYSNAKQNAFHVCHAMSASKRRDETLNIIEEWVKATAELGGQVLHAPEQAQALFNEIKANIMQFWMDLNEHDALKRQEMQEHWNELKGEMGTDVAGIMKHFREEMLQLQKQGSQTTQENLEFVQSAFNKASESVSTLATKHQENAVAQVELYEYAIALFQQGVIQAIGNATKGLANQQELMTRNYESLLNFGVALADMVLKVESTEARLAAVEHGLRAIDKETKKRFDVLQSMANQTEQILQGVLESAGAVKDALGWIQELMNRGWSGVLGSVAAFGGFTVAYFLLVFGLWRKWSGLNLVGACCVSMASALLLSLATMVHIVPTCQYLWQLARDQLDTSFEIYEHPDLVAGSILVAFLCACSYFAVRRRRKQSLYDPASPPTEKWTV